MTDPQVMSDVPLIGPLRAWEIKRDMGVRGERRLENLVAKIVRACAEQNFGRHVFEDVYLAGFYHGATMMERKLVAPPKHDASEPSHD